MKNNKGMFDIALISPPWWLIPSENIITATEHIIEDYSYNFRKYGYNSVIFSREMDYTDQKGLKDVNKYNNKYIYIKVSKIDRKIFNKTNTLLFYLIYILRVSSTIRRLKIKKIVVFQTISFCYWVKIFNPKSQVLYYTVNHELSRKDNYYEYGLVPDKLVTKIIPKIQVIITMSEYIKRGIINRFPDLKNKCKVVYVGIDTDVFRRKNKKEKERVIIYSGRIVPEKGVHLLSTAFKNLHKEFKDLRLYILGGEIGPNIPIDYLKNFNHKGIKMFGLLPRKDVAKILRKGSIFVYPVIWEEPFGLAPIEAMAVGIPTVVSDTKSGYTEIITKENGFYFDSNNEKDLERLLRDILLQKYDSEQIVSNAVKTVKKKLSWEECIRETMSCFTSI